MRKGRLFIHVRRVLQIPDPDYTSSNFVYPVLRSRAYMSIRHLQGAASDRLSQRRRRTSADAGHITRQTAHPVGSSSIPGSQGSTETVRLIPHHEIGMITESGLIWHLTGRDQQATQTVTSLTHGYSYMPCTAPADSTGAARHHT